MHASIWHFTGDPEELLHRYDAMAANIPAAKMRLHLCLRAPDGILLIDTCPNRAAFEHFTQSEAFRALREHHGLPEPDQLQDFPVYRAIIDGRIA